MTRNFMVALLGSVFLAPAAMAQDFSGGLTFGLARSNISDVDVDLTGLSLDGRLAYNIGSGVTIGSRFNTFSLDVSDADLDLNGNLIGLDVSYAISDAFSAGVFYEHAEVGVDISGTSLSSVASSNTYGIEGSYTTGALKLGAFVSVSDTGGLIGLALASADVDVRSFGLSASYSPSSQLTVGGSAIRTTFDIGAINQDFDVDYIGLAGVYDINDTFTVFGGLSRTSQNDLDLDVTTIGLGVAYDLTAMAGMPMSVSLELARTTPDLGGSDIDIDTVRLGLSIPLGTKTTKAPLNSTADAILNPSHNAITQTVLNF